MMDRSGAEAPLAELLDPAIEHRLREARIIRRAEAISRRSVGPLLASEPIPAGPPHPAIAYDQPAAPPVSVHTAAAAANTFDWWQSAPIVGLIFLAGLGIGGIAVGVMALRTLPSRIPVMASAEPTAGAAAPSPVPPNVPVQQVALSQASTAESEPATPAHFWAFATPMPAGLTEPVHEPAPPAAGSPLAALPTPPQAEPRRPAGPQQALSAADVQAALAVPTRRKLTAANVQAALAALGRAHGKRRR